MARILITNNAGTVTAEVEDIPGNEECISCGDYGTDRGHFEDTVQTAVIHVDYQCPYRYAD